MKHGSNTDKKGSNQFPPLICVSSVFHPWLLSFDHFDCVSGLFFSVSLCLCGSFLCALSGRPLKSLAPTALDHSNNGTNPNQIIRYRGLTDLAEKHGYIVCCPMGYSPRGWYGQAVPKFSQKKDDPDNVAELSEKDVMNVLGIVKKEFKIDPDRIYLMG